MNKFNFRIRKLFQKHFKKQHAAQNIYRTGFPGLAIPKKRDAQNWNVLKKEM
jgi:hypothetical protein